MSAPTGDSLQTLMNMITEAKAYIVAAPDPEDATEMQAVLDALQELMSDVDDVADQAEDSSEQRSRPTPGQIEERQAPALEADGKRIRGVIPYNIESRDLGGWKEIIDPGALNRTNLDDLVVTVDHAGLPLGRYPNTLQLEDRADGMHWSVDPPASRQDVREAVARHDLKGGSWRMIVGKDRWDGNVRHVTEIRALRDVAIVTTGAYPADAAAVELRTKPDPAQRQEDTMANEAEQHEQRTSGALQVEDRAEKTEDRNLGFQTLLARIVQ